MGKTFKLDNKKKNKEDKLVSILLEGEKVIKIMNLFVRWLHQLVRQKWRR